GSAGVVGPAAAGPSASPPTAAGIDRSAPPPASPPVMARPSHACRRSSEPSTEPRTSDARSTATSGRPATPRGHGRAPLSSSGRPLSSAFALPELTTLGRGAAGQEGLDHQRAEQQRRQARPETDAARGPLVALTRAAAGEGGQGAIVERGEVALG